MISILNILQNNLSLAIIFMYRKISEDSGVHLKVLLDE